MPSNFEIEPLARFDPQIGLLLACIEDSTREWRENLGDVPVEAIVWQAPPQMYNIGTLILHMIDCEDYWLRNIIAGLERDSAETRLFLSQELDQYGGRWPVPPARPLSWYYELQDRIRIRAFESIRNIPPDQLLTREGRDRTYSARWIVAHVLEHDSYTGGQAVMCHELWKALNASGTSAPG